MTFPWNISTLGLTLLPERTPPHANLVVSSPCSSPFHGSPVPAGQSPISSAPYTPCVSCPLLMHQPLHFLTLGDGPCLQSLKARCPLSHLTFAHAEPSAGLPSASALPGKLLFTLQGPISSGKLPSGSWPLCPWSPHQALSKLLPALPLCLSFHSLRAPQRPGPTGPHVY